MSLHLFPSKKKNEYTLYPMYFCCYTAQHRFSLTLTLRRDKKAHFTSSGSSLPCLHFPIVLSRCHPAVKPFGGEEDE